MISNMSAILVTADSDFRLGLTVNGEATTYCRCLEVAPVAALEVAPEAALLAVEAGLQLVACFGQGRRGHGSEPALRRLNQRRKPRARGRSSWSTFCRQSRRLIV